MPTIPGHQRNVSQGQHLIVDRTESDEEDVDNKAGRASETHLPHESIQMEQDDAPYGNGGVYPGSGSPPFIPSRPQDNKSTSLWKHAALGVLFRRSRLLHSGILSRVLRDMHVMRPSWLLVRQIAHF
uniref:Uncharacterized protein n=1 Tax=Caenorhabditis tropicalis TaxID=1561998 RepID=A0A1I7UEW7_9PELO